MNRFKKLSSIVLTTVLAMSVLSGCGQTGNTANTSDRKVKLKLGIWPEATMTSEITLHEGYKAKLEDKDKDGILNLKNLLRVDMLLI